jgi:outer membrane immunogenic protein
MKYLLAGTIALFAFAAVNAARAADMAGKAPQAPVAASAYSWTGFYVGANAGYGWSDQTDSIAAITDPAFILGPPAGAATSVPVNVKGFIGGAQFGYNWQLSPSWLLGLEADFSGSDLTGTNAVPGTDTSRIMTAQEKLDWLGTVRGRFGILPTDRIHTYLTGGLAYGHAMLSTALSRTNGCTGNNCEAGSVSDTKVGWTVGGGAEWAFASNWSVRAEYLYVDLGSISHNMTDPNFPFELFRASIALKENIVRAGLNYKFGN